MKGERTMARELFYIRKPNPFTHVIEPIDPASIEANLRPEKLQKGQVPTSQSIRMIGVSLKAEEIINLSNTREFPLFRRATHSEPFNRYLREHLDPDPDIRDEFIAAVQPRPEATLKELQEAGTIATILALCETLDTAG